MTFFNTRRGGIRAMLNVFLALSLMTSVAMAEGPEPQDLRATGSARSGDCEGLKREQKNWVNFRRSHEKGLADYKKQERVQQQKHKKIDAKYENAKAAYRGEKDKAKKQALKTAFKDAEKQLKTSRALLRGSAESIDVTEKYLRTADREMKKLEKEQKRRCEKK
ncbi:hypothetical protein [Shimia sp. Alg240-R146]|uniref:hypothetical protein n=1 Tax=Shimia sp. Alg240-R146 TaxID=2993449 RepID=UPI0022E8A864|nr:hypothetical protein [Shimia sp. Alg240-R146]